MAKNFYKYDDSYFEEGTHTKIADVASLQNYAKAGGKEIQYTPDSAWQKIATANDVGKYDVKGQFGSTLYGTLKAPVSTGDLGAQIPTPQAPTIQSLYVQSAQNSGNTLQAKLAQAKVDASAKAQQEIENIKTEQADIEKRRETEVIEPYKQISTPFREQTETKYNDKFEVERQIQQSIDLADDIVTYSNLLTEELTAASTKVGTSVTARNAKMNTVKDTYTSRIATAQAAQAAISGNISLVRTHIDRAINAITADREDQLSFINFVNSTLDSQNADNKDELFRLNTEEKERMTQMEADIKADIARIEDNKTVIMDLMSGNNGKNPEIAVAAHKAGILLTDDMETVSKKLNDYYAANPQISSEDVKFGVVSEDEYGNKQYGFFDTTNKTITFATGNGNASVPADGEYGGQCGDYIHSIMDGTPKFGDTWQTKQAAMNVKPEGYVAQVGDVVAFKTNMPYGHVAVVTSVNQDGSYTVTESNFKMDEKVSNGRVVSANSPDFLGAYRGAKMKYSAPSEDGLSTEVKAAMSDPTAVAYAKDILAGKIEIANVPGEAMRNKALLAKSELEKTNKPLADQLMAEGLQDKIKGFDSVLDHEGMAGAVGVYGLSRWTPFQIDKTEQRDFIASVEQLIQQETIDKLIQSKAAGATYGALSDGERSMLTKAASKIGSWRITSEDEVDANGEPKIIGYEISEESMKEELKRIRDLAQRAKDRIMADSIILPPGQMSDNSAYDEYLKTINQ